MTPTHHAVEMEDLPRLRQLLDDGADVEDPDEHGMTLLHHAVDVEGDGALQRGGPLHVEVTVLLLIRGARLDVIDREGRTPLDYARANGHWLAIELFEAWRRRQQP
ncbi:ankyrin repeat domain-containing protein [Micromonospora sp. WMMD1076]|uniref:ankyrin repeat domain-containing protein n=1 Tax=Micromonospora sp. WMMD1076 TaxID=3016103 RepID=UPI00249CA251|nr:ankyrin repeat domain-containing protein [Micromonospora sp. WMMD1076]WFF04657.1 ankyrin repeat domain-containing protein [Micromonospora sp. WMMD1076]